MRRSHNINLLPPQLQQQRRRLKMLCILAAAQVVVFLLLGGALLHLRGQENRLHERSQVLATQINAFDRTPIEFTDNTPDESPPLEALWPHIELPLGFDPAWLQAILDTVPPHNSLLTLEFDGDDIVLNALAESFDAITQHQQFLEAAGFFSNIHLGATQRLDSGQTRYTLRLIPSTHE